MNHAHAPVATDGTGFKVLPRCNITGRIPFAYETVLVSMGPANPGLWSLRILHSRRSGATQGCAS